MTTHEPALAKRYLIAEVGGLTPIYWSSDIPYPTECEDGDIVYDSKTDLLVVNDGNSWKVC